MNVLNRPQMMVPVDLAKQALLAMRFRKDRMGRQLVNLEIAISETKYASVAKQHEETIERLVPKMAELDDQITELTALIAAQTE
jgi:hypothetical protein